MPTYVYRREDGSTFEVTQRISEDALTVDPETGQRVERVITGAGLVFKGSGFYLTDYARKPEGAGKTAKTNGTKEGPGSNGAAKDAAPSAAPAASSSDAKVD
ncbi:MAG: FmdB family zinc ribbon protein [Rubricoccaceae bacterium]